MLLIYFTWHHKDIQKIAGVLNTVTKDVTVSNTSFKYELISSIFGVIFPEDLLCDELGFDKADCDDFCLAVFPSSAN
jgi:hypothetical protein